MSGGTTKCMYEYTVCMYEYTVVIPPDMESVPAYLSLKLAVLTSIWGRSTNLYIYIYTQYISGISVKCVYHAPTVAPNQVNTVIQNSTSRPAASLQDGRLQDIPLICFRVIAFNQHHIQMRESYTQTKTVRGNPGRICQALALQRHLSVASLESNHWMKLYWSLLCTQSVPPLLLRFGLRLYKLPFKWLPPIA